MYERARAFSLRRDPPADDGLPLPPRALRMAVAGTADPDWFLESGRRTAAKVEELLARHGRPVEEVGDLLDFGCGCGRVARHWRRLPRTAVHGTDVNGKLVSWCAQNLTFATFSRNDLAPPLAFPDRRFDAAYAFSVLTHLPEELTFAWLDELARVLRPGGLLVVSTHGEAYVDMLPPEEQERFRRGEAIVQRSSVAGTNLCSAIHPAGYIRAEFGRGLEVLEHVPAPVDPLRDHDLTVLRKPATGASGPGS
jgi:SAM-dependent methyltransferase